MELIFLYQQSHQDEPEYMTGKKNISVIYWGDYASPYTLLNQVKPDVVVFADIESFNQLALNISARNKGIKTFVLQHGIRGAYEVDEALSVNPLLDQKIQFSNTSGWSFRFLMNSLRLRNLRSFPSLVKFIFSRKKNDLTTALFNNQFELRRADVYLEFSDDNAGYHRKRDGIPLDRFLITGNPTFDGYFNFFNQQAEAQNYCLLIDCPFVEAGFNQDHGITQEKKNDYIRKLSIWSTVNGYHLKVKLHPLSYKTGNLYQSEALTYIREVDLKKLIAGAAYVFFVHFSSIAPIIMMYKPAIYFHAALKGHGSEFRKLGVPELPLFEFDESKQNLTTIAKKISTEVIHRHVFMWDGMASARIKSALLAKP